MPSPGGAKIDPTAIEKGAQMDPTATEKSAQMDPKSTKGLQKGIWVAVGPRTAFCDSRGTFLQVFGSTPVWVPILIPP